MSDAPKTPQASAEERLFVVYGYLTQLTNELAKVINTTPPFPHQGPRLALMSLMQAGEFMRPYVEAYAKASQEASNG